MKKPRHLSLKIRDGCSRNDAGLSVVVMPLVRNDLKHSRLRRGDADGATRRVLVGELRDGRLDRLRVDDPIRNERATIDELERALEHLLEAQRRLHRRLDLRLRAPVPPRPATSTRASSRAARGPSYVLTEGRAAGPRPTRELLVRRHRQAPPCEDLLACMTAVAPVAAAALQSKATPR